jgi:Rrf2 family protein
MRVSQRLDYALRALVLLAAQPVDDWVAAGDLAERLGLPKRFVEQQVSALSRAGITDCRRGSAGGCRLARPADDVTVREVIEALQGEVLDVPHQSDSATAEFWQETASSLSGFTGSRTLAELVERQNELDLAAEPIYYI